MAFAHACLVLACITISGYVSDIKSWNVFYYRDYNQLYISRIATKLFFLQHIWSKTQKYRSFKLYHNYLGRHSSELIMQRVNLSGIK